VKSSSFFTRDELQFLLCPQPSTYQSFLNLSSTNNWGDFKSCCADMLCCWSCYYFCQQFLYDSFCYL